MPPKGSTKAKTQDAAAQKTKAQETPVQKAKTQDIPPSKPKPKPKPKTDPSPRKPKEPIVYKALPSDQTVPIDVTIEGESVQSKSRTTGDYGHVLKLLAPGPFTIVKSTLITSGDYKGMQAILVKPADPFRFLDAPMEARKRIYELYFAPKGVENSEIVIEGKRKDSKDLYAKLYADGQKNRVALLAVNKEINEEAVQIFYAHKLRFENTTAMHDFIAQIPPPIRTRLTNIAVNQWVKTTSRNAMMLLSESKDMKHLHIESGVFNESDPAKAAKSFYADAYKLLEAIGAAKGDKAAGVDVLSFGKNAFVSKEDKKNSKPWADSTVEEFKEQLKGKLK